MSPLRRARKRRNFRGLHYTPNANIVAGRGVSPLGYRVLYSFGKSPDGTWPEAGVISTRSGTFYGTTFYGGANCAGSTCLGTVFAVTTGGKEKVLHSFGSGADGSTVLAPKDAGRSSR